MKKRILALSICCVSSVLLLTAMGYMSNPKNHIGNGFLRSIPSKKMEGLGFVAIRDNVHYLAGGNGEQVYLGNWIKPFELLKVDYRSKKIDTVRIQDENVKKLLKGSYVVVDKAMIYLMDGINGRLFSTDTGTLVFGSEKQVSPYSAAISTGDGGHILRVVQNNFSNNFMKVGSRSSGNQLSPDDRPNSMFATDGSICVTPDHRKMFYSFYYKNQFLCLDKDLHTIYNGKTIDTCATAQIKVSRVASDNSLRVTSPPRQVNYKSAANNKWLFVQSAIAADNDTQESLRHLSVVDVYDVEDGNYQFSIYIPHFKDGKMIDFKVYDHLLVALYQGYVYFYQLNF